MFSKKKHWNAINSGEIFPQNSPQKLRKNLNFNYLSFNLYRPAFAPLYSNQYYHHNSSSNLVSQNNQWNSSQTFASMHLDHHHLQNKRDFDGMSTSSSRKEKRQYKKRKHKAQREVIKPSGKRSNQYVAHFMFAFYLQVKIN